MVYRIDKIVYTTRETKGKATETKNREIIRRFLINTPPGKHTTESAISRKTRLARETVHKHVKKLEDAGHVRREKRGIYWSDNLVKYKDWSLLRDMFFDTLRSLNVDIGKIRAEHGFLFFQTKDGKGQLVVMPLVRQKLEAAKTMIEVASDFCENGVTEETKKRALSKLGPYSTQWRGISFEGQNKQLRITGA